jgi:glutamate dehydrogenase (NAD(P)+)
MNTDAQVMSWIFDQYSRRYGFSPGVVTGKPPRLHGCVGRDSATGKGCLIAIREVLATTGRPLAGTRFAIQGFGNVGSWLARLLHAEGALVVGVSDAHGGLSQPGGLDVPKLMAHMAETRTVVGFPGASAISNSELLSLDCDVLAPAALGHVLDERTAPGVRARWVLEGANGPCTIEGDKILNERGIVCVPDILANAGGVTVSYFEWAQNIQQHAWTEDQVNRELERHMVAAHRAVHETQQKVGCSMRTAAFVVAIERVKEATDDAVKFRAQHLHQHVRTARRRDLE